MVECTVLNVLKHACWCSIPNTRVSSRFEYEVISPEVSFLSSTVDFNSSVLVHSVSNLMPFG